MLVAGQDKCVNGLCVHSFCNIVEDNKGLGLEWAKVAQLFQV